MKTYFAFLVVLFCGILPFILAQQTPKEYAISKCEKRTKNETALSKCKECIQNYDLPDVPDRSQIKGMLKECVPRKEPKEWLKGKCEDTTEKQEDIVACFECVDSYQLPQNVTRDDVKGMRKACLPKPSLKFKAKRKCVKKLRTKSEVEACQQCVQNYDLPERASCEEVKEMKRQCINERSGREMWTEPLTEDDESSEDE